jgi:hypothetical protein
MSTLETQYRNYKRENPRSELTFSEWKDWFVQSLSRNLEKAALGKDPVISDDFTIGPDGAYEHIETSWQEIWEHLDAWCQKNDKAPTLKELMLWLEENYHSPIKILP